MLKDIADTKPNPVLMKNRKQVKSACTNCRKSKTACSNSRPCERCKTHGLDDCQDIPRKRREKKKADGEDSLLNLKDTFNFSPLSDSSSSDTDSRAFSDFIYENIPGYTSPPKDNKLTPQILTNCFDFSLNTYPTSCQPMSSSFQTPDLQLVSHLNQINDDEEKEKLKQEVALLKQQKVYLETILSSLPHSFYYFCNRKEEGISRWAILKCGYCHLIEYSSEFLNLTGKTQAELNNNFLCIFLYPPEYRGKTQILIDIIGSGRITALSVQQILDYSSGVVLSNPTKPVQSDIEVLFNGEGEPIQIVMRTREIDINRNRDGFFTPLSIKFVNENKKTRAPYSVSNLANSLSPPSLNSPFSFPPNTNPYSIPPLTLQPPPPSCTLPIAQPQMQMQSQAQHSLSCPVDFQNSNLADNCALNNDLGSVYQPQLIIDPNYC